MNIKPAFLVLSMLFACGQRATQADEPSPADISYLDTMPSVEKVLAEMKVKDPELTRQRQAAALSTLASLISDKAGARPDHKELTPDEHLLAKAYWQAYREVENNYATPEAKKAFDDGMEKQLSNKFAGEMKRKFFPFEPPYIDEMPPVQSVLNDMKGSNATLTKARQAAALLELFGIVDEMAGPRFKNHQLTNDENQIRDQYYTAYRAIEASFPDKPSARAWLELTKANVNPKFRDEILQKYFTADFRATYKRLTAPPAVLTITLLIEPQSGAANPVVGQGFFLLKDDLNDALTKGGFQAPAGMSPRRAMELARLNQTPDLQKAVNALLADSVDGIATTDANGKAAFPALPAGTYYLAGGVLKPRLAWNLKVELKPGENSVTIDSRNAAPFK